ncbi:positive regulation of protein localization to cilium [Homalodisca vitripennis]|nr:positive regulation of protein localization to cilium [Homalodisca vitripennis]
MGLEEDRRSLMEHVSLLFNQYHELLTHSLEDKEHYHTEEKLFRLVSDIDSNMVEHYNLCVAMFAGGKRTNLIQKNAYKIRCAAAVFSHNTGTPIYKLHKVMMSPSPGMYAKKYKSSVKRKAERDCNRQAKQQKVQRSLQLSAPTSSNDKLDYGPHAQKPDIDHGVYTIKAKEFI